MYPWRVVLYVYPRTSRPGEPPPEGWDSIPGARGCTPQSCAFRDHFTELRSLDVAEVYALSTQDSTYQRELVGRLHLPFPVLSDAGLRFTTALRLPTFTASGLVLLKRVTFVINDGVIRHVFYPVFPRISITTSAVAPFNAWFKASRVVSALAWMAGMHSAFHEDCNPGRPGFTGLCVVPLGLVVIIVMVIGGPF